MVDPVRKVVVVSNTSVSRCRPVVQLQRQWPSVTNRYTAYCNHTDIIYALPWIMVLRAEAAPPYTPSLLQYLEREHICHDFIESYFNSKSMSKFAQFSQWVCTVTLTVVNHTLFGENHKQAVDFKYPHPWCDDHWHLAGAVKVTVDVVLVKHCERHGEGQLYSPLFQFVVYSDHYWKTLTELLLTLCIIGQVHNLTWITYFLVIANCRWLFHYFESCLSWFRANSNF